VTDPNEYEEAALIDACEYGFQYLQTIGKVGMLALGEKEGITGDEYLQFIRCAITGYIENLTRANGMLIKATQNIQTQAYLTPDVLQQFLTT
jgi:hypothetical protein